MKFGEGKNLEITEFKNMSSDEVNLSNLNPDQSIRVRMVGGVKPLYRFWVKTLNGKNRPVFTPFWDESSEQISFEDPLLQCANARKEFFYLINCINRTDGKMKVLILKKKLYQYIVGLANNPEYGDPTDPTTGYDITVTKKSTGPLPINVAYEAISSRNSTPMNDEESALELFDLDDCYKAMGKEEYINWVVANTGVGGSANSDTPAAGTEGKTDDIPF